MMAPLPVIAVFDIGKTNKKLFLIGESYQIHYEASTQFHEIVDEDGFPCEDINALASWVGNSFREVLRLKEFEIKAINFSSYGASLVYLDKDGKIVAPLYNYLKPFPEPLKKKFYSEYGGEEKISLETASPVLGNLNSGMQLYRIKYENPELFAKIKYALHLPQFLSFLKSGLYANEVTSIGCHTQLWNFENSQYHKWVENEQLLEKFPPTYPSNTTFPVNGFGKKLRCGIGLHDSSAALTLYLSTIRQPFLLISTGTWCISLNPFNETPLTIDELRNDCLKFLSYKGTPIKSSRFFAGHEHEKQVKLLAAQFDKDPSFFKSIKFNMFLVEGINNTPLLKKLKGAYNLEYNNEKMHAFATAEEAYHDFMLNLVIRQFHSTKLVIKGSEVKNIFVDGGFCNNEIYMNLLALLFPEYNVYAASIPQASALGAAMAIHEAWNPKPIPDALIKMKLFSPVSSVQKLHIEDVAVENLNMKKS